MKHFDLTHLIDSLEHANQLSRGYDRNNEELFKVLKQNTDAQALAQFIFTGDTEAERLDYALSMFACLFQAGQKYEQLKQIPEATTEPPQGGSVVSVASAAKRHLWPIAAAALVAAFCVARLLFMVDGTGFHMLFGASLLAVFAALVAWMAVSLARATANQTAKTERA